MLNSIIGKKTVYIVTGYTDMRKGIEGLTVNSSTKDIDLYHQMCFDVCQDLQDLSKRMKEKAE